VVLAFQQADVFVAPDVDVEISPGGPFFEKSDVAGVQPVETPRDDDPVALTGPRSEGGRPRNGAQDVGRNDPELDARPGAEVFLFLGRFFLGDRPDLRPKLAQIGDPVRVGRPGGDMGGMDVTDGLDEIEALGGRKLGRFAGERLDPLVRQIRAVTCPSLAASSSSRACRERKSSKRGRDDDFVHGAAVLPVNRPSFCPVLRRSYWPLIHW